MQEVGLGLVGVVDAIWWLPGLTGTCKEDVVDGGWPGVGEWPTSEPPPDDPEKCPVVLLAFTGTVTGIVEKPWSPYLINKMYFIYIVDRNINENFLLNIIFYFL